MKTAQSRKEEKNYMSDIFISYKREEYPFARQLADTLERQGLSTWWDPQLRAGEYFDDVIEAALVKAQCVVVLWSARAVKSRFVKDEATYALNESKLVPALIEDARLPFRFATLHTIQLFGWDGSEDDPSFQSLLKNIRAVLERKAGQERLEPDPIARIEREIIETRAEIDEPAGAPRESDLITPGSEFGDTLSDGSNGPLLVALPAGRFNMGDTGHSSECPVHEVTLKPGLAFGKYPVLFQEYDHFASITDRQIPDDMGWGRSQRPVINVSWHDAVAYANWLSEQTGNVYRLPSEAEWEFAARAGTDSIYWWGDNLDALKPMLKRRSLISFTRLFHQRTTKVGEMPKNPFGLHDMLGNVFEWVGDCWHHDYNGAPTDGSPWLDTGNGDCALRVMRGGAWDMDKRYLRCAARHKYHPALKYSHVGFRVAREL